MYNTNNYNNSNFTILGKFIYFLADLNGWYVVGDDFRRANVGTIAFVFGSEHGADVKGVEVVHRVHHDVDDRLKTLTGLRVFRLMREERS